MTKIVAILSAGWETSFEKLVRYIHLDPLRARIVTNLEELERYWAVLELGLTGASVAKCWA